MVRDFVHLLVVKIGGVGENEYQEGKQECCTKLNK